MIRAPAMPSRMRTYHMESYSPGRSQGTPPQRSVLWLRLGAIAVVALAVAIAAMVRHAHEQDEPPPLAAARVGRQSPEIPHAAPAVDHSPGFSAVRSVTGVPQALRGSAGRRYHVQVGALTDKAAAAALARQLRVLGYAVRIVGAQPYLVWVGGYFDEPTANRLLAQLRGRGFHAVLTSERPQSP